MKKYIFLLFLVLNIFLLSACNKENQNTNDTLRYENLSVVKGYSAGSFDLSFTSLDEGTIYYVVTPSSVEITKEKDIVKPNSKYISGNAKNRLIKTVNDLETGERYNIFIVIFNGSKYSDIVKYSLSTKTELEASIIGDGSLENPFQINTITDLNRIGTGESGYSSSANYILMNNIDLKEEGYGENNPFTPIGRQSGASKKLTGDFDGNDKTISNLYVVGDSGEKWGLFSEIDATGSIHDLFLEDVYVESNGFRIAALIGYAKGMIYNIHVNNATLIGTSSGDSQVGGVVGAFYGSGIIYNCSVTNTTIDGTGRRLGGVVGSASAEALSTEHIKISNCYADVSINGVGTDPRQVGGILGYGVGTTVKSCIAKGDILGSYQVGGIVGYSESTAMLQNSIIGCVFMGDSVKVADTPSGKTGYAGAVLGENTSKNGGTLMQSNYSIEEVEIVRGSASKADDGITLNKSDASSEEWFSINLKDINFKTYWIMDPILGHPVINGGKK